ncbi:MAG: amidase [Pseudomonadota bacterium]
MDDLLTQSGLAISAKLAAGNLSCLDYLDAVLARVDAVNPAVNAIVARRDPDLLRAEARAAQKAPRRSWLHGMPVAIKDTVATADIVTTWGSPLLRDNRPAKNDVVAERLLAAGAILIGKTNVPEFGLGSHSYNPVYGVTRNPYDRAVTAGGSSGGAAAALACRMLSVADGSDMMGSLRNPAAWNNVYGHRPSHSLIPGGVGEDLFLHPLVASGPMARDPSDLAALLEILAGPHPSDPNGVPFSAAAVTAHATGLRIGWLGDWGGAWPMEPGLIALGEVALARLADLGAVVEPLAPPMPAEALWQSWRDLRHWAIAQAQAPLYADPANHALMKAALIWEIEGGRALSNAQILEASTLRSDWFRAAAALFERYDVLAMPATQVWPFPATQDWPKDIAGHSMDTYHRWMECVIPASLIGLPATALPAGFGAAGLPGGIQIVGPRGADARLLSLASAYHAATDWPGTRPPPL